MHGSIELGDVVVVLMRFGNLWPVIVHVEQMHSIGSASQ